MRPTLRQTLNWFNYRSWSHRYRLAEQLNLLYQSEHHLWTEHSNNYRDKDIGYLTIAGQRVKAKRVYETGNLKGLNWITLDSAFKVGV